MKDIRKNNLKLPLFFGRTLRLLFFALFALVIWPSSGTAGSTFTGVSDFFGDTKSIAKLKAEFNLSPGDASALDWSPEGKFLAVSGILNAEVKVFDVHNKKLTMTLKKLAGGSHGLAYSPDGRFIAAGQALTQRLKGVSIYVWDSKTGALVKNITGPFPIDKPANSVTYLAFSPDGRYLAVGYYGNFPHPGDNIYLYDTRSWTPIKSFGDAKAPAQGGLIFSPDGQRIAQGTLGGEIRIWDVATGQLVREIKAHSAYHIYAISYSPNGKWIASCTQRGATVISRDEVTGKFIEPKGEYQNVRVWDTDSGNLVTKIGDYPGGVWAMQFSRNGKLLAIGVKQQLQIWNVDGWRLFGALKLSDLPDLVTFSPDSRYIAVGAGGVATVWEFKK